MQKKILFIRLDKIGDLVCTLCSDDHPDLKEYSKYWLISKGLEFIPEHADPKRAYSTLTKNSQGFKDLYRFLKLNRFEASVSFQCPWWVHLLLFYFQIPIRVGVLSQWHSFLFLNSGLRQKRSQANRHESDYNFELVDLLARKLNVSVGNHKKLETPILKLQAENASPLLQRWNLRSGFYFIVHPGMAGSALNWPQSKYIEFIKSFHGQFPNHKVVVTGTAADSEYLNEIVKAFDSKDFFINLQSQLKTEELLSLVSASGGILAPSTGVLHLAASLGVPTFGLFSPVKVQRATRWGPRGRFAKSYQAVALGNDDDASAMAKLDIFTDFKIDFEKTLH